MLRGHGLFYNRYLQEVINVFGNRRALREKLQAADARTSKRRETQQGAGFNPSAKSRPLNWGRTEASREVSRPGCFEEPKMEATMEQRWPD
uniref:Uncharacterized protein n=1 Tax=Sphaerodactylus townsendi TaxID=933632 RepID=A0ACB8EVE4_9SAUR